jgi:hypothetical protein
VPERIQKLPAATLRVLGLLKQGAVMPVPYTYDSIRNTVDCRPFGVVVISEVVAFFDAVLADDDVREGAIEVVSIGGVDDFQFSSVEARVIPGKILELRQRKGLHATVIIAEGDLHFGIARMIQILHELADEDYPARVIRREAQLENMLSELSGFESSAPRDASI